MILKTIATVGIAVLAAATAATAGLAQTVKIGSKNFTEQFVVAEIYAQALEKAGITVERRLNLGATLIAHSALTSGDIDLYPEYTGTALAAVVKGDLSGSADKIYKDVKDYYEKNLQLTLLQPTAINNGYAIITLPETAQKYNLKTLSDLGGPSKELSFGAEGGFGERKDGLPGLKQTYGIEFKDFRIFAKLGIRYSALTSGNIDVSYGFSTDWQIADSKLVVLDDDKHLFPPYYLVPVVRQDTLAKNPKIAEVLDKVSPLLTNEIMRDLNAAVERDKKEPKDVAAEFLKEKGV
ncbi:ABC transporter [Phyllobacterium sp. 21LDTY02-6]|jgi:osmoprotectant transport system substrate-binding protein|uniref:glycine betaine ABC transporter substrate-binding protein n=1 Tax=unclassified Phyllobacterium TaxID=2638441 RepID=UPI00202018AD|nr:MULTISPECIES: glycine betaine ABC transporter substrate-binding protein [unclassified Phyllobacterium]MCO4315904.1 ABC transporter [Phyllobacterium sp. 21LDTY02-6]MCX8279673.1 ABC transporter [Phyllobacterium sp. 0TCS1.6C]MCX8292136.1 ABC transporter [Phyllobacterium sp. 0TCS1.6A]